VANGRLGADPRVTAGGSSPPIRLSVNLEFPGRFRAWQNQDMIRLSTMALVIIALAACSTTDQINAPVVDTGRMTPQQRSDYPQDLSECSQYADEVRTGQKAGAGAVGGAVVGGAVGAIFGGGEGAAKGAGSGAVVGGAQGVGQGARERSQVIKSCLRGRGYPVLN